MRFPFIQAVAEELREGKAFYLSEDDNEVEVRLQVMESGWDLHFGDPSYDQDHRGYWASGYLTKSTNCRDLARELIAEAKEHYACSN